MCGHDDLFSLMLTIAQIWIGTIPLASHFVYKQIRLISMMHIWVTRQAHLCDLTHLYMEMHFWYLQHYLLHLQVRNVASREMVISILIISSCMRIVQAFLYLLWFGPGMGYHWPLGYEWNFYISNFQSYLSYWWIRYFLWNCPEVIDAAHQWSQHWFR